jgi:hypothetical protein
MTYDSLAQLLQRGRAFLAKGPVALIFVEVDVEVESTLRHHLALGFDQVVAFMPAEFALPADLEKRVLRVTMARPSGPDMRAAVTAVSQAAPDVWMYYCFNAEYLFFPFCETRSIGELLAFHAEERRDAMLTYVVDLYAGDLTQAPKGVSREGAQLDRAGYYALARKDPKQDHRPKERQLDFYGGLRWRYEEHIPANRRRIDRISIFRSRSDLVLQEDFTFSDQEYNTYACPWHNNLTAAVCSFRTAKALKTNPGSSSVITTFSGPSSVNFTWHSRQLLDLGLMEPGQWF